MQLSRQEWERTIEVLKKFTNERSQINRSAAAKELGISLSCLAARLYTCRIRLGEYEIPVTAAEDQPIIEAKPLRREKLDLEFLRKELKQARKDLAESELAFDAVAGLIARPLEPPIFVIPNKVKGQLSRSVGLLQISDIHFGEVVEKDAIQGVNSYSPDIAKRRLERCFVAAAEIVPRWASDTRLCGVVVALNGDLVSGDIHDELVATNALTSHEQMWEVAELLAVGIRLLADKFGDVWVIVTPGNHGRTTRKPQFKRAARASYDISAGQALQMHFKNDERVAFHIATGRDAVYPVLGWTIMQTHGDGTLEGGEGFGGPAFPIVRGVKKIILQAAEVKRDYDLVLTAHKHTSMNTPKTLANGSVIGVNEYSDGRRYSPELPQQWLALIHEKWGLRERCEIKLEDPTPPNKIRVRVPSRMVA